MIPTHNSLYTETLVGLIAAKFKAAKKPFKFKPVSPKLSVPYADAYLSAVVMPLHKSIGNLSYRQVYGKFREIRSGMRYTLGKELGGVTVHDVKSKHSNVRCIDVVPKLRENIQLSVFLTGTAKKPALIVAIKDFDILKG